MGFKITSFQTDVQKEQDGIEIEIAEGAFVTVASEGSKSFQEAVTARLRGLTAQIRSGSLETEKLLRIQKEEAAKHILRGWRGIEGSDGKPLVYSPEKALELFLDPSYHSFYDLIMSLAKNQDNYRSQTLEESKGNS